MVIGGSETGGRLSKTRDFLYRILDGVYSKLIFKSVIRVSPLQRSRLTVAESSATQIYVFVLKRVFCYSSSIQSVMDVQHFWDMEGL